MLRELRARSEKAIIVVSHAGFLRVGVTGRYFMNADYRIFDFVDGDGDGGGVDGGKEGESIGEGEGKVRLRQWDGMEAGGMRWSWDQTVPLGDGLPEEEVEVQAGGAPSQ